jgi:uncharacterized delta-60 repeat protein
MRRWGIVVGAVLAVAGFTGQANAATVRYAESAGNGPAAKCPKANPCSLIDAVEDPSVSDGDKVVVLPGTYYLAGHTLTPAAKIKLHGKRGNPSTIDAATAPTAEAIDLAGSSMSDLLIRNSAGTAFSAFTSHAAKVERVTGIGASDTYASCGAPRRPGWIRDSVCINTGGGPAAGVFEGSLGPTKTVFDLVNVTAISTMAGPGPRGDGLRFEITDQEQALIHATNVIASGTDADIFVSASGGLALASLTAKHSDFATALAGGMASAPTPGSGTNITAAPNFRNPGALDYRQKPPSPTVNKGGDNSQPVGIGKFDFEGEKRVHGKHVDIGADELSGGAGSLDPAFDGDGWATVPGGALSDQLAAATRDRKGRILACGWAQASGSDYDFSIVRLRPNGKPDKTFSDDGVVTFDASRGQVLDLCTGIAAEKDGDIVVAGDTTGACCASHMVVARFSASGELDTQFGRGGTKVLEFPTSAAAPASHAYGVAIEPDRSILVTGQTDVSDSDSVAAFARLRPGGGYDRSFSKDGRQTLGEDGGLAAGLALDGKRILAAGSSGPKICVYRLRANGKPDASFSKDGVGSMHMFGSGRQVELMRDGRVVVSGTTNDFLEFLVAVGRLKPNGALDKSFSKDGRRTAVYSPAGTSNAGLLVQGDGRIVVGGGGLGKFVLMRFTKGGDFDKSFDGDGKLAVPLNDGSDSDQLYDLAPGPRGDILAVGQSHTGTGQQWEMSVAALRG